MPKLLKSSQYAILAIDPGVNGGLATINSSGSEVLLWDMPSSEADLWNLVRGVCDMCSGGCHLHGVVEWIHPAIPKISKADMSKLYGSYMQCRMVLTASKVAFETVMPVKWQRGLGIQKRKEGESTTSWKKRLKAKAQQLFPNEEISLKTADALLLAEYFRRFQLGMIE